MALAILVLAVFFFPSCHNENDIGGLLEDSLQIDGLNFTGPHYGSIVPDSTVKQCLDAYLDSMKIHGIDTLDARDTSMTVHHTLKATQYESFRGTELMKFLNRATALHRALFKNGKKHLEVHIAFGICTENYLKQNKLDMSRMGRIAVFLVTREWQEDSNTHSWVLLDTSEDPDAFDFGGLQP